MTSPEDKERELKLRESKLQEKERELKLRELEMELDRQQTPEAEVNVSDPPLYQTKKHHASGNSFQRFGRKIVKFAKFAGFVVAGIAIIKAGFFVGMWITYLIMAGIIAAIGYQMFLKED